MGHLEKEVSSCAAMTGCLGREDVEVTILSKQYTESTMFRWTADDRVQVIESPFRKVIRHERNFTNWASLMTYSTIAVSSRSSYILTWLKGGRMTEVGEEGFWDFSRSSEKS